MNTPSPSFTDPKSTQLWQDYFHQIKRLCHPLSARQSQDIVLEIKAHLLESLFENEQGNEFSRLEQAIERLGDPSGFVPSWVEDRLRVATEPGSGFRDIYRLLRINARKGLQQLLVSMLFGFFYMLVFFLFTLAILKGVFPANIGLYTSPNGIPFIGFVDAQGFTEHLGWWFIPIGLSVSLVLMWLLSRMLERFQKR